MISIRVVHVIYSFGIGGLEKGISTLINHGPDDIEHIIISLCGKRDSETLLRRSARIICMNKQGGNSPRFILDLAKVIRAVHPDVDGNPELVADGETGFLVDPHKPRDMADKITAYMDDPDMMAQHG